MMYGTAAASAKLLQQENNNTNTNNNNQSTAQMYTNNIQMSSGGGGGGGGIGGGNSNLMGVSANVGPGGPSSNLANKLKDSNNSLMFMNEQHQRKLEMLESRFLPLNPQKVSVFNKFI